MNEKNTHGPLIQSAYRKNRDILHLIMHAQDRDTKLYIFQECYSFSRWMK